MANYATSPSFNRSLVNLLQDPTHHSVPVFYPGFRIPKDSTHMYYLFDLFVRVSEFAILIKFMNRKVFLNAVSVFQRNY